MEEIEGMQWGAANWMEDEWVIFDLGLSCSHRFSLSLIFEVCFFLPFAEAILSLFFTGLLPKVPIETGFH